MATSLEITIDTRSSLGTVAHVRRPDGTMYSARIVADGLIAAFHYSREGDQVSFTVPEDEAREVRARIEEATG
jgi:hypothetical protein